MLHLVRHLITHSRLLETRMDIIGSLPADLTSYVFQFCSLDQVNTSRLVCRGWKDKIDSFRGHQNFWATLSNVCSCHIRHIVPTTDYHQLAINVNYLQHQLLPQSRAALPNTLVSLPGGPSLGSHDVYHALDGTVRVLVSAAAQPPKKTNNTTIAIATIPQVQPELEVKGAEDVQATISFSVHPFSRVCFVGPDHALTCIPLRLQHTQYSHCMFHPHTRVHLDTLSFAF
eukprot:m.203662 g.203662  ORF g.203662 m.203662 type:complete len:229 (+) comp14992_c0_seq32:71-757(+)